MSNHYQVVAKQTLGPSQIRNVFYFSGAGVGGNLQEIADYVALQWDTHLKAELVNEWSLDGFDIRDVGDLAQPSIPYDITLGAVVGTHVNPAMAHQVALLVSFKVTAAPPNSARKYLGGWQREAVSDGSFSAAKVTAAQAWADGLLNIGVAVDPGIGLATVNWNAARTQVLGANILTSAVAKSNPAIQRSRRIGSGI